VPGVHAVEVDGHVGPPAPRQRARRRPLLDAEQLAEGVAAEEVLRED